MFIIEDKLAFQDTALKKRARTSKNVHKLSLVIAKVLIVNKT